MISVKSFDELMKYGVDVIMEHIEPDQIELKGDFIFTIRICGETWDDAIDYRSANFIKELQKAVNKLYIQTHGDILSPQKLNKTITVKVRVAKGSLTYNIDLGDVLSKMVGNMTGPETLILTGICAATIAAGYTIKKVLDYKKEVKLAAIEAGKDEKIVEKLSSTIDKALGVIEKRDMQAPVRKLVNKLDEDDTISLPGDVEMSAKAAKQIYPKKPKSKKLSGRFDSKYTVKNINLSERPPELTIKHPGIEFQAAAELADDDITKITNDLEASMKRGGDLTMDLHVFILYNERKIISASIQGTGTPRINSQDIDELIKMF